MLSLSDHAVPDYHIRKFLASCWYSVNHHAFPHECRDSSCNGAGCIHSYGIAVE